ncbi:hypothetical protein HMPREF0762_01754 [Slackia exigua ATCC 700122]|uniref:Uncharacterized protein n=1 Tax=Slackia exigua (strain ATCC 700122 / DSM 15923 / CIP 105133 / JCM 11022 / KCTC 5966 / S-7) TaxID=649764 RepID=D0WIS9_SLAES|nr:hypothetical protein HMPREF0762_01754 [Slackia exigua ATCC 700122]
MRVPIGERACRLPQQGSWKKPSVKTRTADGSLMVQWEVRLVVTESDVEQS